MKNKGFTLIELIVVITILAILGTIAFIGFKGYTGDARNSKITTDISNLNNVLGILKASEGVVPMPDAPKEVVAGAGNIVTYEGEIGANVRTALKASKDMVSPTGENYQYAVDKNQKNFSLIAMLEEETANVSTNAFAAEGETMLLKGSELITLFDSSNNFVEGDILNVTAGKIPYLGDSVLPTDGGKVKMNSCSDLTGIDLSGVYKILNGTDLKDVYCLKDGNTAWTLAAVFDDDGKGDWAINSPSDLKEWASDKVFGTKYVGNPFVNAEQKYNVYSDLTINEMKFVRTSDAKPLLTTNTCGLNTTLKDLFANTAWQTDNATPICTKDKLTLETSFDHTLYNSTAGQKAIESPNFGALSIKVSDGSAGTINDDAGMITTTNGDVGYMGGIQAKGDKSEFRGVTNGEGDWNTPKQADYGVMLFVR